ncbi:nucleotidyltransferase family protein [Alkalimarinus coralli]|uniref:nucleotidyltransferase family protein n=1 Tax=Alkalimarinus coralli TaxID=2935863 RepID=UPI00202B962B|nr:nucleotidyltransferase family protein [Alkalimarinus coralli]
MHHQTGVYVLLAAGFSRRFGSPKLLHELPSGNTIIATSISALAKSGCGFIVVIRDDDAELYKHLSTLNIELMKVSHAIQGLASVIAEVASNLKPREYHWIGICLGDMPYIKPETYVQLSRHASRSGIVRPFFNGKPGHPVLFGQRYFTALTALTGDDGAKSVIKASADALQKINVTDEMVLYDIDRPEQVR